MVDYSSWSRAQRVCVIGAGTMGSGIAAHLANLGFQVSLLDVTRESAIAGFDRARNARPPHFYYPERAHDVLLAAVSDSASILREADWVCEAIVEKLGVKKALYAEIEPFIRPDAMVSTNTSGLQIELLAEGMSAGFKQRFMGTHFFNPPRYLKLLELIPTPDTDPAAVQAMVAFLEDRVARRVVLAKDTPGFIANRFGMWSMFHAIHSAERLRLTVEQVDAITGPFLGRPKSASFRLNDIVGLDIMQDIATNLITRCPHDPHVTALKTPASMQSLLDRGWIGEKVGQGYYRREGRELLALDLTTFAYRNRFDPNLPGLTALEGLPIGERIREALKLRDEVGDFLRTHLIPVLRYADFLKEEISHNVQDFDRVMKWGFGWQLGPFEMIDAIGGDVMGFGSRTYYSGNSILGFDGAYHLLKAEPQYIELADLPIIGGTETYNLRDMGDGVTAVSTKTKMGVITLGLIEDLTALLETGTVDRFVLTSEARSFSAGFDLKYLLPAIEAMDFLGIDANLAKLQRLGELLEQHRCVAAIHGHCLGAGLELAISCSQIVAGAESQIGLPEAKIGLLPGGRGTTLMRLLNQNSVKRLCEVALTLTEGAISTSADHARLLGYLRATDVTEYHPDRLLARAKEAALTVERTPRPAWLMPEGPLVGMIDRGQADLMRRGVLTGYDETIGDKIKVVFAKAASYEDALNLERAEFIDLCRRGQTLARIRHMLETGKPMKN